MIEGTAGEEDEEQRDDDLVLRLRFDLAFGVHGKGGGGGGVGSGEGSLDVLCMTVGQVDLFEVKAESSRAGEVAGGFGLGDGAHNDGALGYGDGVVGVVDGLGDDCVDGLA